MPSQKLIADALSPSQPPKASPGYSNSEKKSFQFNLTFKFRKGENYCCSSTLRVQERGKPILRTINGRNQVRFGWLLFCAVVFSGFQEAILQFKILPFSVMLARLCPPGCEGSVMAFFASSFALANIFGGYFGIVVAGYFRVSEEDSIGLPTGIVVGAACSLVPLLFLSWIPGNHRHYVNGE